VICDNTIIADCKPDVRCRKDDSPPQQQANLLTCFCLCGVDIIYFLCTHACRHVLASIVNGCRPRDADFKHHVMLTASAWLICRFSLSQINLYSCLSFLLVSVGKSRLLLFCHMSSFAFMFYAVQNDVSHCQSNHW